MLFSKQYDFLVDIQAGVGVDQAGSVRQLPLHSKNTWLVAKQLRNYGHSRLSRSVVTPWERVVRNHLVPEPSGFAEFRLAGHAELPIFEKVPFGREEHDVFHILLASDLPEQDHIFHRRVPNTCFVDVVGVNERGEVLTLVIRIAQPVGNDLENLAIAAHRIVKSRCIDKKDSALADIALYLGDFLRFCPTSQLAEIFHFRCLG